jgi:RHS repeat-associated protein
MPQTHLHKKVIPILFSSEYFSLSSLYTAKNHLIHLIFTPPNSSMTGEKYRFGANKYRYGFNGKEKDDEGMGGGGQTYDYGFRIYNPGLAKFLSVDPLSASYPWYTPYQFAGNMPISSIDLDGLEEKLVIYEFAKIDDGVMQIIDAKEVVINASAPYSVKYQMIFEKKTYTLNSYTTMKGRDPIDSKSPDNRKLGNFSGVTSLSNEQLGEILSWANAVISESDNIIAPVIQAASEETLPTHENGWYGLLDFKIVAYDLFKIDKNNLLEINGVLYDPNEAGNYLWSMVLNANGISVDPCAEATEALEDKGLVRDNAEAEACAAGADFGEQIENGSTEVAKEVTENSAEKAGEAREKVKQTKKVYINKN